MNIRYNFKYGILVTCLLTASVVFSANQFSSFDMALISKESKHPSDYLTCFKVGQTLNLQTDRGHLSVKCISTNGSILDTEIANKKKELILFQEQLWNLSLDGAPIVSTQYGLQTLDTKVILITKTFMNTIFSHQKNTTLNIFGLNSDNLKLYAEDIVNLFQTHFPNFFISIQVENEPDTVSKFEEMGFLDVRKKMLYVSCAAPQLKPSIFSAFELKLQGMSINKCLEEEIQLANSVKHLSITIMRKTSFMSLKNTQEEILKMYVDHLKKELKLRLSMKLGQLYSYENIQKELVSMSADNPLRPIKIKDDMIISVLYKSVIEKNFLKTSLYHFIAGIRGFNKHCNDFLFKECKLIKDQPPYNSFIHFVLHSFAELGYDGDLKKGYSFSFSVPQMTDARGKKWPSLMVSFWAKGSWCIDSFFDEPIKMPDIILDIRETIQPNTLVSSSNSIPRSSDIENTPFRYVVSDKGIQSGDYLFIKKEGSKITLERLLGENAAIPFSSENTIVIEESGLEGEDTEKVIPLPEDDLDLEMIQYLLAEKINEEAEKEESLTAVEEIDDEETDDQQEKSIYFSNSEKERMKKLIEDQKRLEIQKREAEHRQEMIKKIAEEIERKERYDALVKQEQEEVTRAVIERTIKSKKSKKSSGFTKVTAAESDVQSKERIYNLAVIEFEKRRVKMNEVANCLNTFIKKNPQIRSLLSRQKGSHLVFNGNSTQAGPTTLVIPHGGDGTISRFSANTFFENFVNLIRFSVSS